MQRIFSKKAKIFVFSPYRKGSTAQGSSETNSETDSQAATTSLLEVSHRSGAGGAGAAGLVAATAASALSR